MIKSLISSRHQKSYIGDKLQSLNVANQYVYYPDDGHGWDGADLTDSFDKITAFIKLHVN
jgi:hypothetical protein